MEQQKKKIRRFDFLDSADERVGLPVFHRVHPLLRAGDVFERGKFALDLQSMDGDSAVWIWFDSVESFEEAGTSPLRKHPL